MRWASHLLCAPDCLIDRLIARFAQACGEVHAIVPVQGGQRGNPVLIARALFARLASLTGDEGAKYILNDPATMLIELAVENAGILADIDTPEDLRDLASRNPIEHN